MAGLPTFDAWLDGLPNGAASFPGCQVKGTNLRAVIQDGLQRPLVNQLPVAMRRWLDAPPLATQWVPEVHQLGMILAAYDAHFALAGGESAFLAWAQKGALEMLSSPLYRAMFALAGPTLLLHGMARRWESLRRGTTLSIVDRGDRWAEVELSTPPRLYDALLLRVRARTFQSAVLAAGGKAPSARVTDASDTRARFRVEWR